MDKIKDKCKEGHLCKVQYKDKNCPYDKETASKMSVEELSEKLKIDYSQSNKTKEEIQRAYIESAGGEYNLSKEEIDAIHKYVNSFNDGWYKKVNETLRNGKSLTEEDEEICHSLDSALDKITKYQGNLLRVINLNDAQLKDFLKTHSIGNIVTYQAYTSASSSSQPQMKGNVYLIIKGAKNGSDLRKFNPLQSEILYKRNSTFRVERTFSQNGTYFFELKEI